MTARRIIKNGKLFCPKCKRWKSLNSFYNAKNKSTGKFSHCKKCYREYTNNHRQERRNTRLIRKYDITLVEYDQMFEEQNGVCYICEQPNLRRRLCVDHRHLDGKVRKLLCDKCNLLIGFVEETPELLSQVAEYLEEHK